MSPKSIMDLSFSKNQLPSPDQVCRSNSIRHLWKNWRITPQPELKSSPHSSSSLSGVLPASFLRHQAKPMLNAKTIQKLSMDLKVSQPQKAPLASPVPSLTPSPEDPFTLPFSDPLSIKLERAVESMQPDNVEQMEEFTKWYISTKNITSTRLYLYNECCKLIKVLEKSH